MNLPEIKVGTLLAAPVALQAFWRDLDPQSRLLTQAILVSLLLHALVLSIRFQMPDVNRFAANTPMEVVIVNSKSKSRPTNAQVLAQANLDGGGNTDEARRAKSNSATLEQNRPGNDVRDAQRRVEDLET